MIQLVRQLLQYGHLYVCSSADPGFSPYSTPELRTAPRKALDVLLYLSGRSLLTPKDKPPYNSKLPEHVNDRLKTWEAALAIDPVQKKKLSLYDDAQVAVCITNFLDLHFSAFSGTLTFNPVRSLKSTIHSSLSILEYVANILHDHRENEGANTMLTSLTTDMVPMSCDIMMEFSHSQLLKFVLSDHDYSFSCTEGRVSKCLEVLRLAEVRECELVGVILANLFRLLMNLLQDVSDESKGLELFAAEKQSTSKFLCVCKLWNISAKEETDK